MKQNNPFAKNIPSVFVVCSPFQALCAIATIRQLEIRDYKMVVWLPTGEVRNAQLTELLKREGILYKSFHHINKIFLQLIKLFALKAKEQGYSRLFIGDYRNYIEHYIGFLYIKDGADIVYLDDGNITIDILKGTFEDSNKIRERKIIEKTACHRNLEIQKNLLTIFSDIPNPQYNIEELKFENVIIKHDSERKPTNIYIVGTHSDVFCKSLEIPEDTYIHKLSQLMKKLRFQYPDDEIVFISHGREYKDYGQRLCKEHGCGFIRPETMIEVDLLNRPNPPKAIYGYTSTALYTLKKMFPATLVVNIFFEFSKDNPFYKGYIADSEYYQQNGIEWIKEPIS